MEREMGLTEDVNEVNHKVCIKRRNRITLQQKKEICEYKRNHPEAFAREIFLHFRDKWPNVVAPSTISKILMTGEKWLNQHEQDNNRKTCTRIYQPRNLPLEDALYKWYGSVKDSMNVSNEILKQKAKALAKLLNMHSFSCSNNWVYSFKKRHGLLKYTHKVATGASFLNIDLDYPCEMQEQPPSSVSNKANYLEDGCGNGTIYVTAPVTTEEARQGLVSTMGYLAAQSGINRDNIDMLWTVFQQISNKPEASKMHQTSEDSVENNAIPDENPVEGIQHRVKISDICDEELKISLTEKAAANRSDVVSELYDQCVGKPVDGTVPEAVCIHPPETIDVEDISVTPDTGKIHLAVQGADGKYMYVMAESDTLGEDFNLNESLPQILEAAGHSLEDGTQFIETVDQISGLRMITKHLPESEGDALIETLGASPDQKKESLSDSIITIANGVPTDHAYVTVVSADVNDGIPEMETTDALPHVEVVDEGEKVEDVNQETLRTVNAGDPGMINTGCIKNEDCHGYKTDVICRDDSLVTNSEHVVSEKPEIVSSDSSVASTDSVRGFHLTAETTAGSVELPSELPVKYNSHPSDITVSPTSIFVKPCFVKVSRLPDSLLKAASGKERVYVCTHCGKSFTSSPNLEYHLRGCESIADASDLQKANYPCCLCDKVFSRRSSLNWHMRFHNSECMCLMCSHDTQAKKLDKKKCPDWSCKDEPAAVKVPFISSKDHSSDDGMDDIKLYSCHTCGSCFKTSSDLEDHWKTHTKSKEWRCLTCQRCFSRSADMKRHSRVHLLPADVSCRTCGKTFVNRSNLLKHYRLHTGIQDYNCSICGKCFSDSATLKEHKKVHSSIRNKRCEICGQTFILGRNLKMHMLIHDEVGTSDQKCTV